MDFLDIAPIAHAEGSVQLPGSKSISNRTLLLAALADGATEITHLLKADDVDRMCDALHVLGVPIEGVRDGKAGSVRVRGVGTRGGFPVKRAQLLLGNAGTAFRPLTAALALAGGDYALRGTQRMHERPIADLVDALRTLGADIRYMGNDGFPPLQIGPRRAPFIGDAGTRAGHQVSVRGDVSSQFLSALLMALPIAGGGTVDVVGELISKPYVSLTLNLMRRFGIDVTQREWQTFVVPEGATYRSPGAIAVEGDASSASYFLAAGAIGGGPVRVIGAGDRSIQGDVRFIDLLAQMGAHVTSGDDWIEVRGGTPLRGIDADCNMIPDAAMTAAIVALFAAGPTTLRNIGSWRVKETDRIAAMAIELRKLGAGADEGPDWLRVVPPKVFHAATIDTYDDHRMAMCFSLAALGGVAIRINDPRCVQKTFPEYFDVFARLAGLAGPTGGWAAGTGAGGRL